jgi:carbon monoxide dehydrogenase subunit G
MVTAIESSYARDVQVLAPRGRVFDTLATAAGLVRFMPQVDKYQSQPEPERALVHTAISLGPLAWQTDALLQVDRVVTPSALRITITMPSLQITLEGEIDLAETSATETLLTYRASIRSTHRLMRRLRSSLTGALEEHIDTTTERIATLARQHAEAERRLTDPQRQGQD